MTRTYEILVEARLTSPAPLQPVPPDLLHVSAPEFALGVQLVTLKQGLLNMQTYIEPMYFAEMYVE